jgi:hypothetical protein
MSYDRMAKQEEAIREQVKELIARAAADAEEDKSFGQEDKSRLRSGFQLIVGQLVTQAGNDKEQVQPMVQAIEEQSGQLPAELLADPGYCSDSNLEYLESEAEPKSR